MALETSLILRAKDLASGNISKVSGAIRGLGQNIESISSLTARFGPAGLLGAIGGSALVQGLRDSAQAGRSLEITAKQLSMTTDQIQDFRNAARLSGVDSESFAKGMANMTKKISEASKGIGEAQGAFRELRLNTAELAKMKASDQLYAIADGMAKLATEGDRLRVLGKIFGEEGGRTFGAFMANGAKGIKEMNAELKNMARLTPEEIENLSTLDKFLKNWEAWAELSRNKIAAWGVRRATAAAGVARTFIDPMSNYRGVHDPWAMQQPLRMDQSVLQRHRLPETVVTPPRSWPWSDSSLLMRGAEAVYGMLSPANRAANEMAAKRERELFALGGWQPHGMFTGAGPVMQQPDFPGFDMEPGMDYEAFRRTSPLFQTRRFSDGWKNALRDLRDEFDLTWKTAEAKGKFMAESTASAMTSTFDSVFFDAFSGQMKTLGEYFNSFLKDIGMAVAHQLSQQAAISLLGAFGMRAGGAIPARASGGPVISGKPYWVGERGPELIVPSASGNVIPNGRLKGGGVTVNVINQSGMPVTARQEYVRDDLGRQVIGIVLDAANRNGQFRAAMRGAIA